MLVSASRATRSLCHAREEILAFLEQLVCGLDSDNALSQRLQAAETFLEHRQAVFLSDSDSFGHGKSHRNCSSRLGTCSLAAVQADVRYLLAVSYTHLRAHET